VPAAIDVVADGVAIDRILTTIPQIMTPAPADRSNKPRPRLGVGVNVGKLRRGTSFGEFAPLTASHLGSEDHRPDDKQLWFINTRFSCLCTLNAVHSFVPCLRPRFITALAPEDRCHLIGLALAPGPDSQPVIRFVTALAVQQSSVDPGVGPRRAWIRRLNIGALRMHCQAARDFHGHLAFVGLSQVRDRAVFGGVPIA
jgi:hypothetical protein